MKREAIDGDSGELTTLDDRDPLVHSFITRLDDELLAVVVRHQRSLARAFGREVSRAAAVREVLRRALPKRRLPKVPSSQLNLWPNPNRSAVQGDAVEVARRAERRAT